MYYIDKIITNSKPFKDLQESMNDQIREAVDDQIGDLTEVYLDKVDKLVDLTIRVHNTILSVKHNYESL